MKTKNNQNKHFHQHLEQLLRHKMSVVIVTALMCMGAATFDGRMRGLMQQVYAQSWDWLGTYLHHEHPMHSHGAFSFAKMPTTSGPGPS
jgi:hypothetical protein